MGDRTPAAGPARLTERDLASIERMAEEQDDPDRVLYEITRLVAALRAAWAENARDREALAETEGVLLAAKGWLPWRAEDCAWPENRANVERVLSMIERIERERAALAAPGAGEEGEA